MRPSTRWFPPDLPTRITPRPALQRLTEVPGSYPADALLAPRTRPGAQRGAAGSGSRYGTDGPKQYAPLEGRTVIEWALAPFLADPRCAHIVVALARDDAGWVQVAARLHAAGTSTFTAVGGGAQRSQSVRLALAALDGRPGPDDWVLVHDAARPCLDAHELERLLGRLGTHPVGGLLAIPVADTLKRAQGGETVDRSGLWRALNPQMFRYGRLCAGVGPGRG